MAVALGAQSVNDARKLFDAGKFKEAIDTTSGKTDERLLYVEGQSHEKLNDAAGARRVYDQLAGQGGAWGSIGRSAIALLAHNTGEAQSAANEAVAQGANVAEAHYQLGLAQAAGNDFAKAAQSFETAARLDPSFAYAHYYAGLAYSKVNRLDQTAPHFEAFLKMAPNAPERPAVESIMRTIRGR